jgi:ABC-type lipoprotein export system ATPase subunit
MTARATAIVEAHTITALLRRTTHQEQIGLLVATYDVTVVEAGDRVLRLQDGRIVEA